MRWIPRTVNAKTVALAGRDVRQIAVPNEAGHLRQIDARLIAFFIEQTELDALRGFGEDGEVGAGTVVSRAERVRISGPDLHKSEGRSQKAEVRELTNFCLLPSSFCLLNALGNCSASGTRLAL